MKTLQFEVTVTIAYTYAIQVRAADREEALKRIHKICVGRARGDLSEPLGSDEACSLLRETLVGKMVDWSDDPATVRAMNEPSAEGSGN
jgi:hypothetical protein